MRPIYFAAAAALIVSSSAGAAPLMTRAEGVTGLDVVQVHNSCHQNTRTHGGNYPNHYHNPGTCQVVVVQGGGGDCHANAQRHHVPGYGTIWHSHQGNNCAIVQHYQNRPRQDNCVTLGTPGAFSFSFCD
jgi:hypothetical protein